ncbi:MAG: tRNA 2-thiouridine(34) synthase MnmA [Anaerolineales bacterium]|nr:tRNA 2-thiouridine(34) synthase MnmA [Anaerolineales bacterium]
MSGGVDSSVTAALLKDQGYEVTGMMMRLWSEPGREIFNRCCTPDAMANARRVAAKLKIPFYAIDAQDTFHDTIVTYFLNGYTQGLTPNPCLMCNRHIRWEFLLKRALALGSDFMATGHYARLERTPGEPIKLLKGIDPNKDQSYVLSVLNQAQLTHALFPLGDYTKPQVRELARQYDLPVAETKDSQDLCFLAGTDYADFLKRNAPEIENPGPIKTRAGETLGEHNGLAFYTIGQRKGLGIAAPNPLYVVEKDLANNTLVVGEKEEFGRRELVAKEVSWVSGQPPEDTIRAEVKIRYLARLAEATVTPLADARVKIEFDNPLRDITPGQGAVIYNGEEVLGMGTIEYAQS